MKLTIDFNSPSMANAFVDWMQSIGDHQFYEHQDIRSEPSCGFKFDRDNFTFTQQD